MAGIKTYGHVSNDIMLDNRISAEARALYGALCCLCEEHKMTGRTKQKTVKVSVQELTDITGWSKTRYYKYYYELTDLGIITVTRDRIENSNLVSTNIFCIHD